jgi:prolycopene isomerase
MNTRMFLSLIAVLACFSLIFPNTAFSEDAEYDVVVIGAGGGGLGAAAALARNGMKVLIIEQHEKVGGYMTSFERYPYTFEVSLHAMDGLDPGGINRFTFDRVGITDKVKLVKLDPMYRTVYPEHDLIIPADADEYRELLKKEFPREAEGIESLFKTMEKIYYGLNSLMALTQGDYGKAIGGLMRPWKFWPLVKYWNQTLSEMMDDHVHDQQLIAIFTQLSGYAGAEPDNVSAIFFSVMWGSYHFGGYYYFEGGSQAVSNAMAEVIEENGSDILLDTLVTRILIEDGKAVGVQTKPGDTYRSRYVVSNANAPDTFFKLVGREHLPKDYLENIENMKIGMSSFVVYIGVDHDYRDLFQGMHQIMINDSYDTAESFKYMYEGIPEKTGFAIANYSVTDPLAAPEGKNAMQVISILPYDWKDGWYEDESYEKYDALKTETAMIYIKRAEQYLPGLSDHIEEIEVGSPRTMEHYTLNPKGTIFGWDNTPEQSLLKRLPQKTPIENLYLAGAWTFPGGGQSAVISSGIMAADKIMKKDRK